MTFFNYRLWHDVLKRVSSDTHMFSGWDVSCRFLLLGFTPDRQCCPDDPVDRRSCPASSPGRADQHLTGSGGRAVRRSVRVGRPTQHTRSHVYPRSHSISYARGAGSVLRVDEVEWVVRLRRVPQGLPLPTFCYRLVTVLVGTRSLCPVCGLRERHRRGPCHGRWAVTSLRLTLTLLLVPFQRSYNYQLPRLGRTFPYKVRS